ncbi:MAG: L-serine ammonia-lyase, iron-sulfur-dependent, subunit alpha [Oscillospiraceae bacterium]
MYTNISSLLEQCRQQNKPLHKVIMENESIVSGLDEQSMYNTLRERYSVMLRSASRALDEPQEMVGNLISGQSRTQSEGGGALVGEYLNRIMSRALSCSEVNASMGVICAAPTAGSCGIIPAVVIETAKKLDSSETDVLNALAVAGAFGAVITKNATVSGAEGGCQAECGVAAAMAAAAAVYLAKGSAEMCADASAIALIDCMGLVCDPVAGLVQLPCSYRNASQAVNAVISADMALAGQHSAIPADEVIEAMYRVGKQLPPELRETAQGGIAKTPTAKDIAKHIFD